MPKKMNAFDWTAIVLIVIGALNWGLVGLFNFDLVKYLSFGMDFIPRIIYTIVGFAGLYSIYSLIAKHKK